VSKLEKLSDFDTSDGYYGLLPIEFLTFSKALVIALFYIFLISFANLLGLKFSRELMNFDFGEYIGDFGGELLTCALRFLGLRVLWVVILFFDAEFICFNYA